MAGPKAHEMHEEQSRKAADKKHEPATVDDGAAAAGEAAPKGHPSSDRHQTETAGGKAKKTS